MDRFLLEFGIRALLVACGTAVVLRAAVVRTASARHRAWTGVLLLMLLLPVWMAWGPKLSWKVLSEKSADPGVDTRMALAVSPSAFPQAMETNSGPTSSSSAPRSIDLLRFAIGLYVLVAGTLLLRLGLGTIRAHKLIRSATHSDGLLSSNFCASPITVGWFRPVAVLPVQWREWPQRQLDAILAHESEHVRRYDPLIQWLALLNRALFWFHPLAWWLERHLAALAEEACDVAVLAKGHAPEDYSEYLLKMADSVITAGRRVSLVGMAMPGSFLSRRIPRLFEVGTIPRISRMKMACIVVTCAISSMAFASGTLEHRETTTRPVVTPAATPPVAIPKTQEPTPAQVQTVPVPTIEMDARIVTASKAFSREFGSQLGLQFGRNGQGPVASVAGNSSGIMFLTQPGKAAVIDQILSTAEAGGTLRAVSRPRLTTPNDVAATISQGTQIPVQTNVNNTISVSFLTFALRIEATPHVVAPGVLSMKLSVENSQPDFNRAANGVPAVSTQKSAWEVLMNEGSTAMIVGNFVDAQAFATPRQVPGLGVLPAGNLLGQTPSETEELLLFITPRIKQ